MKQTTRTERVETPENQLKALRAQMGEKAFYAALHRMKYRTLASIPLGKMAEVLERLLSE